VLVGTGRNHQLLRISTEPDVSKMEFSDAPSRAERMFKHNDILVSTVRTYLKAIALAQDTPENRVASSGFAVLRPNNRVNPEYLYYVLRSKPFVDWIVANSEGVSYPAISTQRLSDMRIPVPDHDTQENIIEFINTQVSDIDTLINKGVELSGLLYEKRQALITAAVTGQIDMSEEKGVIQGDD
jgi:type I restriction enzyme S subunit